MFNVRPNPKLEKLKTSYREAPVAMAAFEAGFVIRNTICRHSLSKMNSFATSLAFLYSAIEGHFFLCLIWKNRIISFRFV